MSIARKTAFAVTAGSILLLASPAQAQRERPPKPDLAKIAASMDVPESALKACMGDKPKGQSKEGGRPPRPDAAKISACLKTAGHEISEDSVNETLSAFGPQGRRK